MVPNPSGVSLPDSWAPDMADTLSVKLPMLNYFHNLCTIRVIAFIQDDVSKKVQQTAITEALPCLIMRDWIRCQP